MGHVDDGMFVKRARELRSDLVHAQATTERATHYGPEIHAAFREAGFYQMLVPRRYGGHEVDVATFLRVIMEVGRGCMDTAWSLCLVSNRALQVGSLFTERVQEEVFGGGEFRAASVAAPTLRAVRVDGGWQVDGTAAYCSGLPYATWFLGQAHIEDDDEASPRTAAFLAPRESFVSRNDWGSLLGLKGTGSDTAQFERTLIPEDRFLENVDLTDLHVEDGTPGLTLHGNPVYCGRAMFLFTASLAAPIIGGARAALDEYASTLRRRTAPLTNNVPRVADPDYQRWYGAALARINTAEAALLQATADHTELCRLNALGERTYDRAADFRLAATAREVCIMTWEAVEHNLLRTIGSSALRAGERFERLIRNFVQVAGHQNFALRDRMFRAIAADELGVTPAD